MRLFVCRHRNREFGQRLKKRRGTFTWLYHAEQISDRFEIEDVLTRYCYAVDDREWDLYRGLFTPDAVIDDRVTGGLQSGVEEHIEYLRRALSTVVLSQHAISTVRIDLGVNNA